MTSHCIDCLTNMIFLWVIQSNTVWFRIVMGKRQPQSLIRICIN